MEAQNITTKDIDKFFEAVRNNDSGAYEELKDAVKQAASQEISNYISQKDSEGDEIAGKLVDDLLEEAVSGALHNQGVKEDKSKKTDRGMADIKLSDHAVPVEGVTVNWMGDCGEEPLYMRLHLPTKDETENNPHGRKTWVTSIEYCGEASVNSEIEARLGGYFKDGAEIRQDEDGNEVFSGVHKCKISGIENAKAPELPFLLKLSLERKKIPVNSAIVAQHLEDDNQDEHKEFLGKILLTVERSSSKGGRKYPYDIEALYAGTLTNSMFKVKTNKEETFYILKWNLGNFRGTALEDDKQI